MVVNRITIPKISDCVLHEQKVYASHKFGGEKNILRAFVVVRGESDEGEEIWVAKVQ